MTKDASSRLAYRAYMYELFHVVFGATPSTEEIARLQNGTTAQALEYYASEQQNETRRDDFLACWDAFAGLGREDGPDVTAAELRSSHTRLFLVPGESFVRPWESPYVGKEVMLFQESTLDVRRRYAEHGFEAAEYQHFPEDHLAMMLHFLGALSSEAYEAHEAGDDGRTRTILSSQRDFIEKHLANWLPKLLDDVDEKDTLGFFRTCAHALDAFLQDDAAFLARTLSEAGRALER